MPQPTKKHKHEHRHPDSKKTISELLAAGQGNAIMPGDIMEKLYDHEAAETRRRETIKRKKSRKRNGKKGEKSQSLCFRKVIVSLTESFWMTVGERKVALVSQTFKVQMKKTL